MRALKYEIKNLLGNPFSLMFGFILPIFLGILITNGVVSDVPENFKTTVGTSVVLGISLIIPMAMALIGYTAVYAQEVEKNIPLRLKFFGIKEKDLYTGKVLTQVIVVSLCTLIYFLVLSVAIKYFRGPSAIGALRFATIIMLMTAVMVCLAHAIAGLTRKFGPAYGISMALYFLFMLLGGMMGPRYEQFPPILQKVADLIPVGIFSKDAYKIWTAESYNWGPLAQSFIFLGSIAVILLIISIRRDNKRRL